MTDKKYPVPEAFVRPFLEKEKKEDIDKTITDSSWVSKLGVAKFHRIESETYLAEYTFKGYDIIFHFFKKEGFFSLGFKKRLKDSFSKWPGRTSGMILKFHNGPEKVFDSKCELGVLQSWCMIVRDPNPHPSDSDIRTVVSRIVNPRK